MSLGGPYFESDHQSVDDMCWGFNLVPGCVIALDDDRRLECGFETT